MHVLADSLQPIQDTLVDITQTASVLAENSKEEVIKNSTKWFDKITTKFLIRLLIDVSLLFVLIRFIYFPRYKNKVFFLPFTVFNLIIFLITYLLNKVDLSLGAAFGLFAVFGIMRYRSEDISIKNLTYLFIVIAIGLLSAIAKGGWEEILFYNIIILVAVYLLESGIFSKSENTQLIIYDNTALLSPDKRDELLNDLKQRTGYNIKKIEIERIDFLRDSAILRVYYEE
ncbi:MAG: DUF4956 domain-containing protein [Bacteroidetes bacterium]|nr:MAG: DUF4956 domain-containing protein [Bacteroidota bacterium]